MIPNASDNLVAAAVEPQWDDPMAVGCQTNTVSGSVKWCHACYTGSAEPVCWWCGGPQDYNRPGDWTDSRRAPTTNLAPQGSDRPGWRPPEDAEDPWGYYWSAA